MSARPDPDPPTLWNGRILSASVSVSISTNQPSIISASASFTLVALGQNGPVYAEDEEVERVRVTAVHGGPLRMTYITKSGREILIAAAR